MKRTMSYIHHIDKDEKEWLEGFVRRKNSHAKEIDTTTTTTTNNNNNNNDVNNNNNDDAVNNDNNIDDIETLNNCLKKLQLLEQAQNEKPITTAEERRQLSKTLSISFDHKEYFYQPPLFSPPVSPQSALPPHSLPPP